ncbi:pentapeptide repeat-containing protein [Actinoplanes sp. NPDC000266]
MGVDRIELEIGELILDGFPRADRDRIAAAFTRELTSLLHERGMPFTGADIDVRDLPPLPPTAGPRRLGRSLARAVHDSLCEAADFGGAGFSGRDFGGAGFSGTDFGGAGFSGADFGGAGFSGTDFGGTR